MPSSSLLEFIHARADDQFDLIYPPEIRRLSRTHWTPIRIACAAADFLVSAPATRVLDIGCGPGKFCLIGALTTTGHFTGIEQRKNLCDLARKKIQQARLPRAEVYHGNITTLDFAPFAAFYLFNPFGENLEDALRIDASVARSVAHHDRYTEHVANQLARAPLGTRVATYCGPEEVIPLGYECQESFVDYRLKFWVKTKTRLQPEDSPTPIT